jgi:4-nitrophenyl phosphatase
MFNLSTYTAVLFDMDGVLYRGQQRLPGVIELLRFLDQRGITYACATNNSTLTPEQYEEKLAQMGIMMPASRIVTSSVATRHYLETQAPQGTPIYYIGMEGLRKALLDDGYFTLDPHNPRYVISGADFEVTYAKLKTACLAIRAGAIFIGTNPDTTFPSEEGIIPGAGSLLALLRAASETEPFVIGKPEPAMFLTAIDLLDVPPERTLTIGDRLDTDIAGSINAHIDSALVMTGVTSPALLERSTYKPNAVFADLPELLAAWQRM